MDVTAIVIGSQTSSRYARSALPQAAVIATQRKTRPARPKRAAATALRRFATRLDPSY